MRVETDQDDNIEVQMAPLIDCVFLLLIFFLVASTLKKLDKQLDVHLPTAAAAVEVQAPDNQVVIGVDTVGNTYIDAQLVSQMQLQAKLHEIGGNNRAQPVRLDIDRTTPFQYVVQVFDQCQFEGLTNVAIHIADDAKNGR